jgi:hypothetical protein
MREQTTATLSDQWFIDNGYFTTNVDTTGACEFEIVSGTEKWKMLFDTCVRLTPKNHIITPEVIMKVINDGDMKRHKLKSGYKKVSVEEKARRKAERQKIKRDRKLKDANRQS